MFEDVIFYNRILYHTDDLSGSRHLSERGHDEPLFAGCHSGRILACSERVLADDDHHSRSFLSFDDFGKRPQKPYTPPHQHLHRNPNLASAEYTSSLTMDSRDCTTRPPIPKTPRLCTAEAILSETELTTPRQKGSTSNCLDLDVDPTPVLTTAQGF